MLRRRLLVAALLAGALPMARSAAETRKYRLGFLGIGEASTYAGERQKLFGALASLGYALGRNLEIEECYEKESPERLAACARHLAERRVDVVVTEGTPSTLAAQKATRTIPIVTSVGDPVAAGFAHDVRRPGGNITGLNQNRYELARKQVELLRTMRPRLAAIALTWEPPFPGVEILMKPIVEAAREASIATREMPRRPNEFAKSLAEMKRLRVEAAFPMGGLERRDLEAALQERVAIVSSAEEDVEQGSLFCVQPDGSDAPILTASIIDKVLRGANPAETPFQSPTRYITTVNARTAAALGIRLTPELRLRADRLIE